MMAIGAIGWGAIGWAGEAAFHCPFGELWRQPVSSRTLPQKMSALRAGL